MTWVRFSAAYRLPGELAPAGAVREVDGFTAAHAVATGAGQVVGEPPGLRDKFLARLDAGAGRECLFLPFVGEFGHQVMYHVRMVHFHRAGRKIVCCRRGHECLYPSADEYVTDWSDPIDDATRAGTDRGDRSWPALEGRFSGAMPVQAGGLTFREELYCIRPETGIPTNYTRRGLGVDACIGTRSRLFWPEKNWPHVHGLARSLRARGLTYAVIGTRESSQPLDGMTCMSGDYGDVDAAVELLANCRAFVGTDSGSAHLAAHVGCRMAVQAISTGRNFVGRMATVNPGNVIEVGGEHWDDPTYLERAMWQILDSVPSPRSSSLTATSS